jgi:hypothetical protein
MTQDQPTAPTIKRFGYQKEVSRETRKDDRRDYRRSSDRNQSSRSYPQNKSYNRFYDGQQKKKRVVKTASHFKRSQNTRPRKFLARLVDANEEDEPMLVKAYLMELLEEPGDYISPIGKMHFVAVPTFN